MKEKSRHSLSRWCAAFAVVIAGCAAPVEPPLRSETMDPAARRLAQEAVAAAGGLRAWQELETVAFDVTVIAFGEHNQVAATSNEIHWVQPLAARVRIDQLGKGLQVGYDAGRLWVKTPQGPLPNEAPDANQARLAALASRYWFGLPFRLADAGCTIRSMGEERSEDGDLFDKLEVTCRPAADLAPYPWSVYYLNRQTKLVGRLLFAMPTEDGGESVLLAEWLEHWPVGDVRVAHRRVFYAADRSGRRLSGPLIEERLANIRVNPPVPAGWWSGS